MKDDVNYDGVLSLAEVPSNFVFQKNNEDVPILELRANGDILVKGNIIKNDIEVYYALKEFLNMGEKR